MLLVNIDDASELLPENTGGHALSKPNNLLSFVMRVDKQRDQIDCHIRQMSKYESINYGVTVNPTNPIQLKRDPCRHTGRVPFGHLSWQSNIKFSTTYFSKKSRLSLRGLSQWRRYDPGRVRVKPGIFVVSQEALQSLAIYAPRHQ